MNKDVGELVRRLRRMGLRTRRTTKHVVVVDLTGQRVTTLPLTPSDWRWRNNAYAELRRNGVRVR